MTNATITRNIKAILARYGYGAGDFTVRTSQAVSNDRTGWVSVTFVFPAAATDLDAADRCLRSAGLMVRDREPGDQFLSITSEN